MQKYKRIRELQKDADLTQKRVVVFPREPILITKAAKEWFRLGFFMFWETLAT